VPVNNDLIGIILTFAESLSGLSTLVTAATYLLGIFMIASAIYNLKAVADARTMMSQQADITGPVIKMFVGVGLIWWPTLIDVSTYTFWGTTSPLSYNPTFGYELDTVIEVAFEIIRLIGIIAFIRGWYYIVKSGEQGSQATVTKGLTHVVGGLFAYHIGAFVRVLMNTFGFSV
jgi:intracellular multiplication protein IcmC